MPRATMYHWQSGIRCMRCLKQVQVHGYTPSIFRHGDLRQEARISER